MIKNFTFLYLKQNFQQNILLVFLLFLFIICLTLFKVPFQIILYPIVIFLIFYLIYSIFSFFIEFKKFKIFKQINKVNYYELIDPLIYQYKNSIEFSELNKIISYLKDEIITNKLEFEENNKIMEEILSTWIHQIKIPITSLKLILDKEDSSISREMQIDLFRIELYIEMILSYYRLRSPSTDYLFKKIDLEETLKNEIKKFSTEFIKRRIHLELKTVPVNYLTDEKWIAIVFDQLISNALKYTPENGNISIKLEPNKIYINDSGIGIAKNDLPRIFERGYTGFNGRLNKKSSGLGLYLTKEICKNLNISISIKSKINKGTQVELNLLENNLVIE